VAQFIPKEDGTTNVKRLLDKYTGQGQKKQKA